MSDSTTKYVRVSLRNCNPDINTQRAWDKKCKSCGVRGSLLLFPPVVAPHAEHVQKPFITTSGFCTASFLIRFAGGLAGPLGTIEEAATLLPSEFPASAPSGRSSISGKARRING